MTSPGEVVMNLAIEYLMRTKLSQQMLKLPCSLFLNHIFNKTSLVVALHNCYGKPEEIVVKHWHLHHITKDRVLPPVEEFVVAREDMFISPFIVLDDYDIMDYTANPYPVQPKQNADEPYATMQEKQYQEYFDHFFNSLPNEIKRKNWLWKNFVTSSFPKTMASDFGMMSAEHQRDAVQNMCPVPWKGWCMWQTHLICETQSPVATELAFNPLFRERLKTNEKYLELMKPIVKKIPRNKTSPLDWWHQAGNVQYVVAYTDS